jgi:hypothetical protein
VADRLSPLDVSFLYLEEPTTAMHVGSVMIFDPGPDGLDYPRLVRHVEARIAFVPRYRQRVRTVPGRLANPVWVDHEDFDISAAGRSWRTWWRGSRPARSIDVVRSGNWPWWKASRAVGSPW